MGNGLGFGIVIEASEDVLVSECTVTESSNMAAFGISIAASPDVDYCCNNLNVSNTAIGFAGVCEGTHLNLNNLGKSAASANRGLDCLPGTILGQQVFNVPGTDLQRHRGNKFVSSTYSLYGARHQGTQTEVEESQIIVPNLLPPYYPAAAGVARVEPLTFFVTQSIAEVQDCDFNSECFGGQAPNFILNPNSRVAARGTFTGAAYSEMLNWESGQYLWKKLNRNRDLLGQDAVIDSFYQINQTGALSRLFDIQQGFNLVLDNSILEEGRILSDSIADLLANNNLANHVTAMERLRTKWKQHQSRLNSIFDTNIANQIRNNANNIPASNRLAEREHFTNR
ncbi:MAG: hypothetical protein HC892_07995, partial [Saprospiraceae bacterium]|nr:hypothetical protein [Saprospiraceae bacterium]